MSAANAAEAPTATLVNQEMLSWRLLQLEPSALREPDPFTAPREFAETGAHLPAALYHLAHAGNGQADPERIYAQVANRLSELIGDLDSVRIDRDESRQLLTLIAGTKDGTRHPARALSDGTLRFLALAVLSLQDDSHGLICLEEPENGIHPQRIPAMIRLLQDLAFDPKLPGEDQEADGDMGGLRQVIINTHSPAVVNEVPEAALLVAKNVPAPWDGDPVNSLAVMGLQGTWRNRAGGPGASLGDFLPYVNPIERSPRRAGLDRRLIDREDAGQLRIAFEELAE